ncbi:UNVERIFIED_CONTAM: hypothetical protein Sradi_0862400 [Sesamum radiatum]|uniref:DUF8040 domain-containing protein n=1 Tax=Sesamum radiatum TaxID=300843 RepID=A0AAW2V1T4_SESRA
MRSDKRILALITVQQITVDIVVGLFLLVYTIHTLMHRHNPPRRVRPRRYTVSSRIPNQVRNLHRLVSVSDASCLCNLRMDRNAFGWLCYLLEHSGGLSSTKHVTVAEQVAMFLSVIAHHKKNCVVKHDFLRSGRTVSKHFHVVLNTVYKMSHVFLAKAALITDDCCDPRWRWFKVRWGILRSQSFYPINTQNKIILACWLLHNFLHNEMPDDPLELEILDQGDSYADANVKCISSIDTSNAWTNWRDQLASSMYNEWLSRP